VKVITAATKPFAFDEEEDIARDAWDYACEDYDDYPSLHHRVLRMLSKNPTNIRSILNAKVRSHVPAAYGFIDCGPTDQEAVQSNAALAQYLAEQHTFLFKDHGFVFQGNPGNRNGMYQHRFITTVIQQQFFYSGGPARAPGKYAQDFFDPIRLEFIALLYTCAKHAISEWADGYRVVRIFRAEDYRDTYEGIMSDLTRTANHPVSAPNMQKFQKKIFEDILQRCGWKRQFNGAGASAVNEEDLMRFGASAI